MLHYINYKLIGILRTKPGTPWQNAVEAIKLAFKSGIKAIEITSNSNNWEEVIMAINKLPLTENLFMGVGSIKNKDQVKKAISCGAKFLVSPGIFEDVVEEANKNNTPILPGVFLPSEALKAKELKIKDQKFFPANVKNHIEFLNAIRDPFRDEFSNLENQGYKIGPYSETEVYNSSETIISSPTEFYNFYLSNKNSNTSKILIKLPPGELGLKRMKDVLDFDGKIRTYAVGGVNFTNMKEIINYGAYGVCIGGAIFN